MSTPEQLHLEAALKAFGWECGPEFEKRYVTDPWVFNLANAVDKLTYEVERLRASLARRQEDNDGRTTMEPMEPCCDYRDHTSGWCTCPDHEKSDLHPNGWGVVLVEPFEGETEVM